MRKSSQVQRLTKRFGSIPKSWNIVPVGDLFKERQETSNDTARYPLHSLTIETGIVPKTERYDRTFLLRNEEENEYKLVYPGDFVFNPMNLRFGAIAYSRHEAVVAVSAYYNILKPVQDKFDARYLFELLTSYQMIDLYDVVATGSLVEKKRVHWSELRELLVPLPPLGVQRKIGVIVGSWNEAITLTERRIEAARQRKKGLMQRLLTGRVRFPEFVQSQEFYQTKLGQVPADWKVIPIQDVAKVNAETLGNNSNPAHRYLYIELSAVDKGNIVMPTECQRFADLPSRARRVLRRGDVIMATVRPNLLGFAVCDFEPENVLCSTGFALISPEEPSDSQFIYQSLYSDTVLRQVHGLLTGSSYPAISASEVSKLRLFWPKSKGERKRIAAVLQICDREIELLTQKRDALQHQKKGLMQWLLTGRVRVKV
jgi:type I restriction enzyme S subunit